jgi:hypothetical protein
MTEEPAQLASEQDAAEGDPDTRGSGVVQSCCCLSLVVALICSYLGDPCAGTTGVAVLDSIPVFRTTCLGFAVSIIFGCFRLAIIFNSLAFWWVSFAWCMDTYSWWCIFVLEHCFIVLSVTVMFGGKGMLAHLGFTLIGSFTYTLRPSIGGQGHGSEEAEEIWKTGVIVAVSMLVASLLALVLLDIRQTGVRPPAWLRFRRQSSVAAAAAPEPQEAWAGVLPPPLVRGAGALPWDSESSSEMTSWGGSTSVGDSTRWSSSSATEDITQSGAPTVFGNATGSSGPTLSVPASSEQTGAAMASSVGPATIGAEAPGARSA